MLPTGCKPIDSLLGGGLVPKRINQFYGSSGTGKTNLCLQALVTAINSGKKVVYVDTEGGFSQKRLDQLTKGRSDEFLNDIYLFRVTDFSEQNEVIEDLSNIDAGLVIIDSLTSLYRPELSDGDVRETNREMGKQVKILNKIAHSREIPILITNQVYSNFNSESGEVIPVGGDTLKYSSKVIVQLKRAGRDKKGILKKHLFKKEGEEALFRIEHTGLNEVEDNLF